MLMCLTEISASLVLHSYKTETTKIYTADRNISLFSKTITSLFEQILLDQPKDKRLEFVSGVHILFGHLVLKETVCCISGKVKHYSK